MPVVIRNVVTERCGLVLTKPTCIFGIVITRGRAVAMLTHCTIILNHLDTGTSIEAVVVATFFAFDFAEIAMVSRRACTELLLLKRSSILVPMTNTNLALSTIEAVNCTVGDVVLDELAVRPCEAVEALARPLGSHRECCFAATSVHTERWDTHQIFRQAREDHEIGVADLNSDRHVVARQTERGGDRRFARLPRGIRDEA